MRFEPATAHAQGAHAGAPQDDDRRSIASAPIMLGHETTVDPVARQSTLRPSGRGSSSAWRHFGHRSERLAELARARQLLGSAAHGGLLPRAIERMHP